MRRVVTIGGVAFDLRLTFLIIFSTIVPMVDYYNHRITGTKAYDRFLLYFVLSFLVVVLLLREPPRVYGFQLGDWRKGLFYTVVGCVGMGVILWFVARNAGMQTYYQAKAPDNPWRLVYLTGIDLFGWEFIWRGLMLFALARYFGPGPAILLQAVPFAFMHLGKPEIETLTTIFGGIAFGFVAWQSESFLYPFLIHWFIASFTQLIAIGKL
ncbi:MAG: CPBP family intramembrane metalloprotease [Anaerolineales bacterium]|nr:CPBP family intramembrane metalloprotease [Anaerolineales bacterium]MCB8954417.1 CPBP family intramembrane metalloprotease [Ardenticatenales bacterium]